MYHYYLLTIIWSHFRDSVGVCDEPRAISGDEIHEISARKISKVPQPHYQWKITNLNDFLTKSQVMCDFEKCNTVNTNIIVLRKLFFVCRIYNDNDMRKNNCYLNQRTAFQVLNETEWKQIFQPTKSTPYMKCLYIY